jgi:hypothetical protein
MDCTSNWYDFIDFSEFVENLERISEDECSDPNEYETDDAM